MKLSVNFKLPLEEQFNELKSMVRIFFVNFDTMI